MKQKNNHPTSDEIWANLEPKVDAYIELLKRDLLYFPKSERAKWLNEEKWLEYVLDEAVRYAAIMLLLGAKRPRTQDSPVLAKMAAELFQCSEFDRLLTDGPLMDMIRRAVETKNKQFFIDLGKCLSNQMKSAVWDRLDYEIALILCIAPRISARRAVGFLKGFRNVAITEDHFRMRKMRLRRATQREVRKAQTKT